MKRKHLVFLLGQLLVVLAAFFYGKELGTDNELTQYLEQMRLILANQDAWAKESMTVSIQTLKFLDEGSSAEAKKTLIEQLGRYYYNYTYENERYMNSETTEVLLKEMEQCSARYPSFKTVLAYKPDSP